jgi:hypothetical protein
VAGAELNYLPPYSPDLNPIEQGFSKLKSHLRKAQEHSIDALWRRIGKLLDVFEHAECANFFKNSGYARTRPNSALEHCHIVWNREKGFSREISHDSVLPPQDVGGGDGLAAGAELFGGPAGAGSGGG